MSRETQDAQAAKQAREQIEFNGRMDAARANGETWEYAGFQYHVPSFDPVEGQHPAAGEDRHRRAARETYEEKHGKA